jgi:hypothetical protein
MLSLIKDFAITAFIIIFGHWIYGVPDISAYDFFVDFISGNRPLILTIGVFASGAMVTSAAMFQSLGISQVTFLVSKVFARLCQFIINFFSILNIIFYASMEMNLIRSGGYDILVILFITLGASCWALRMIDFNFHTKNTLLPVCLVAFMSVLFIELVWPFFGF